jgi:hypothetical protein
MKLRLKQEEFLEDLDRHCMKRFKADTIFEDVNMVEAWFFKTSIPKKVFIAKTSDGPMRFEEWTTGVFEKIFEVIK